jgi:hypothetical protein
MGLRLNNHDLKVGKGGLPRSRFLMKNGKWEMLNGKFSIGHFPFLIFY